MNTRGASYQATFHSIAVTFDSDPPFVAAAIGDLNGADMIPIPMRVEKGKRIMPTAKDVVILSACLRAAASASRTGSANAGGIEARVTFRPATGA